MWNSNDGSSYEFNDGNWDMIVGGSLNEVVVTGSANASGISSDSWQRYVPVWGSGVDAYDAFSSGDWGWGIAHSALAISDVFLVKSLVTGAGKAIVRQGIKETVEQGTKQTTLNLYKNGLKFTGDEAVEHFGRHADQIMKMTGKKSYNLAQYLDDANWIVENGHYVKELNAYVHFMGHSRKGKALIGVEGLKNGGKNISTFHIKTASKAGL